ncbi:MAG: Gfo/Idh/MocA family oxidoreductase [Chloroflexi bacterium]|nr:Gfo/Idh/MocA family oxidoreductase [Chloroflexota bacterium]
MSEVRWGFVGGGNVTETKAPPDSAFTFEQSRVVAVARTDLARSEAYAEQYGIERAYGSVEELCADANVTAVFVCTPHHLHTQHVLAAIKAGKHVLCEKPLTITTREGLEVVEAAEQAGLILGVAYYRRFYPVMEMLRAIVRSNRLGKITSAQMVCRGYSVPKRPAPGTAPAWRGVVAQAGGGALTDAGSHRVDLLFWLFGDASRVSANVRHVETWTESEDQANVTVEFANGVVATLDQSGCSYTPQDSITIFGTEGSVSVPNLEGTSIVLQLGNDVDTLEVSPRSPATHRPLVQDFVRAVLEGGPVRCPGADGLRTTQLIELAYAASRNRQILEIPDPAAHRQAGAATIPLPLLQVSHSPQPGPHGGHG